MSCCVCSDGFKLASHSTMRFFSQNIRRYLYSNTVSRFFEFLVLHASNGQSDSRRLCIY